MSLQFRTESIHDQSVQYEKSYGTVARVVRERNQYFNALNRETQDQLVSKEASNVKRDFLARAADEKAKVVQERIDASRKVQELKFPGSTNKDPLERSLSEMQRAGADSFLARVNSPDATVRAISAALQEGRTAFAFEIVDMIRLSSVDGPTFEQQGLLARIKAVIDEWPRSKELGQLQADENGLMALEAMWDDFASQVDKGMPSVVLPGLWGIMNQSERQGVWNELQRRGNLTDIVFFKKTIDSVAVG